MPIRSLEAQRPRDLIARILDEPGLQRSIQSLAPAALHKLVLDCGLEDAGPVVALATTEQLLRVFDHDLWQAERPGAAEEFDAERFGLWLEVLVEAAPKLAARKVAEMDFDLVTAAFSRHLLVLDEQSIALQQEGEEALEEFDDPMLEEQLAQVVELLESPSFEVAGFKVVPRHGAPWDALTAVLANLSSDHPAFLGRLLSRCGALAAEWIVDNGGLYEVLTTEAQILSDVAGEREERRAQEGYVTPAEAAAFLRLARERPDAAPPSWDPLTTSYFRRLGARTSALGEESNAGARPGEEPVLRLLGSGESEAPERLATIRAQLLHVREHDGGAYARRTEELGYLANVLVAGCSFQSRRFRPIEAADAVLAACNLGLENWPQPAERGPGVTPFLAHQELVSVFRRGWGLLYERVCLDVARGLVEALARLKVHDEELRRDLAQLRTRMAAQLEAGKPWRERDHLDVLAILDPPSWAALAGLVDECPVVPKPSSMAPGRPPLRVTTEFEFISENGQIAWALDFVRTLPQRLAD